MQNEHVGVIKCGHKRLPHPGKRQKSMKREDDLHQLRGRNNNFVMNVWNIYAHLI